MNYGMQNTWSNSQANFNQPTFNQTGTTSFQQTQQKITDLTPEFTTLLNAVNAYTYQGYTFEKIQELTNSIDNLWNLHLGRIEQYITEKELDFSISTSQRNVLEVIRGEYDEFIELLQSALRLPDYIGGVLNELSSVRDHLQTEAQRVSILQIDTQVKLRIRLLRDKLTKLIVLTNEYKKK
jgi:hypothetical protein